MPRKIPYGRKHKTPKTLANEALIFKDYLKNAEIKIKRNWSPPKMKASDTAIVRFNVTKEGKIENLHLTKMSKNAMFNEACLKAVRMSEPLDTFPKEYTKENIEIEFQFDYNVLSRRGAAPTPKTKKDQLINAISGVVCIPLMVLGICL